MFGEILKRERKSRGLTQKELADKCGITENMMHRYESGKNNPKFDVMLVIAEGLGVSPTVFCGEAKEEKEEYKIILADKIGVAAMLEQTAEECIELAHACMKLARETRGDNPAFKDRKKMIDNMHEEIADVLFCIDELQPDYEKVRSWRMYKKNRIMQRFKKE